LDSIVIDLAAIEAARARLHGQVLKTPFTHSRTLSDMLGAEIWLKFENLQFTASFKERGALNRMLALTPDERAQGVIAVSAGNHAQGVAYHAQRMGVPAVIVMPRFTPTVKVANTRRFGAEVIDPAEVDPSQAVQERTGGRRVELVIEASGSATAFAAIPELARKQATILLYGHGHSGKDLSTMSGVQFLEPTLLTPAGASGDFLEDGRPRTYARALRLLEEGTIEVGPIISHRYTSLEQVPDALARDYRDPSFVKGVVTLGGSLSGSRV